MAPRLIILAAGQGTRLRPLTDEVPKCMVELEGKSILEHQLIAARAAGVSDIHVVLGYRHEAVRFPGITKHINDDFATTNMVSSLFAAESSLDGDVIVSYGDIVYQPSVLSQLIESAGDVAVVVDNGWRSYWEARMEDPLEDAETMILRPDGTIKELGKKAKSFDEIEGQYIGLMKFSAKAIPEIRSFYHQLDRGALYEGKDVSNMYMTTFLQLIADRLMPIKAVETTNGWMEIDCPEDLKHTSFLHR